MLQNRLEGAPTTRRQPLLRGSDAFDQLRRIVELTGSAGDDELATMENPSLVERIRSLPNCPPADLGRRFPAAGSAAIDLLRRMLALDPAERISAAHACEHAYFAEVRAHTRSQRSNARTRRTQRTHAYEVSCTTISPMWS